MDHRRPRKPVLGRILATLLIAVTLATAGVQQARASVGACLSAYTGADFFQLLSTIADPELTQCAGEIQVGPDIIMAAATAGMVALAFDGAFDDTAQCKALVKTTIGGFIAQLLLAAPPVKSVLQSLLPQVAFQALVDLAAGNAVEALDAIPGLNVLLHKVDCGCQFAGAGLATKKALEDYYSSVKGCGEFIADVGDALLGLLESGPETAAEILLAGPKAIGGALAGTPEALGKALNGSNSGLSEGPQQEQTYTIYVCAPGMNQYCDACAGYPPTAELINTGGQSFCRCPNNNEGYNPNAPSGCSPCGPGTHPLANGACGACPPGQAYKAGACVAACPKGEIYDTGAGKCVGCGSNGHAIYDQTKYVPDPSNSNYSIEVPVTSTGACIVCSGGTTFSASQHKCVPGCPQWKKMEGGSCVARCTGNQKYVPGSSGGVVVNGGTVIPTPGTSASCQACPGGTQIDVDANVCVAGGGGSSKIPSHPACAAWEGWDGAACVNACGHQVHQVAMFEKGPGGMIKQVAQDSCTPCAAGSQYNAKTNSCQACPSGALWKPYGDNTGGACACPSGSVLQINKCISTGPIGQPPAGGYSFGGQGGLQGPGGGAVRGAAPGPATRAPAAQPCPAGMVRNAQGVCGAVRFTPVQPNSAISAGPALRSTGVVLKVDCSPRGPNFINNAQAPGGCAACPTGMVANPGRDACVAPMFRGFQQRAPQAAPPPPVLRRAQ